MLWGWLLVSTLHLAILSAGFVWPLPSYSAYYNRQADAFLHGQSHLILRPPAGLLALPDPYDPDANRPFRQGIGIHDSVLFNGKLYLYWGPVPALLLVPLKAFGVRGILGDEWLVVAFMLGATLLVGLILRKLWRKYFPHRSPTLILLGIILFGLATPATYFLSRAAVYEAAIAGGQFFLLLGMWFMTSSLSHSREREWPRDPCSGLCLAAAVGCRASLAIAVVGLALLIAIPLLRRQQWKRLATFAIPLICGAAALANYNYQRFGSVTEFGQKYQLTGANYRATPALFAAANTPPSSWSYLTRPVTFEESFPFVLARGGEGTFPAWVDRPAYYESKEAIVGLLICAPLFLLAGIPLVRVVRGHWRDGPIPHLLVAGVLAFAPILAAVGSTQRYLMDLWPCAAILSAIGLWTLLETRRHIFVRIAIAACLVWTISLGLLLSVSGPYDHLKTWNPTLYGQLGGER